MEDDAPIREFADRGIVWLLESPESLRGLIQLAAAWLAESLDFSRAERQNRSFVPDDLHRREADIVFRVPFRRGEGEVWIYVLVEHQSRPDPAMGLRLLSYMVQLWEVQRKPADADSRPPLQISPIVPIIFYTGRRKWETAPTLGSLMRLPAELEAFVPRFDILFLSLRDLGIDALTDTPVAHVLASLLAADEPVERLAEVLRRAVAQIDPLFDSRHADWARLMHFLVLLVRHKREPGERDSLYNIVREVVDERRWREVEKMGMTDAQVLVAKGRREGRQEGRQEGRREGRTEILLEMLEAKFGPLPQTVAPRISTLSDRDLSALTRKVLTAASLHELGLA
jgi:hypothetical protein